MESNVIVIATLIFLLFSAVLLILMLYTMIKSAGNVSLETVRSAKRRNGPFKSNGYFYRQFRTTSLNDIQDFINAKAEVVYGGEAYALNSDRYKIGRKNSCNLAISEEGVSGVQCEIRYKDNAFTLSDLDSTNGTYVNGHRLTEAVELHDGDEINMGFAVMEFRRRNERKTNGDSSDSSPE